MPTPKLQHFYISEEQSIYLLSLDDAQKYRKWFALCEQQLSKLGYQNIELVGKGAYGFAFAGVNQENQSHVFKFSRMTLPQRIQDRLEDEAFILSKVDHPNVPNFIKFERVGKQCILMMNRAMGEDLEQILLRQGVMATKDIMTIAKQLADILLYLRADPPLVHGDIKPSNLVWDPDKRQVHLIDWGSAVFAQKDANGKATDHDVMNLLSEDQQYTNARMGDVYFIGNDQLNGEQSTPRFDEQGVAATLYSIASGQASRFACKVMPATSIGLPEELARTLHAMLSDDKDLREKAGDYFLKSMSNTIQPYLPTLPLQTCKLPIPVLTQQISTNIETVSYSSRKSFLISHQNKIHISNTEDVQLEKYHHHALAGMDDTEKGFIAMINHLGQFPIVGGISLHWKKNHVFIDSNLSLYDNHVQSAFIQAINNAVILAQGIHKQGTFKICFFNAKNTLHIERDNINTPYKINTNQELSFEIAESTSNEKKSRLHSYFEDGRDPDENLELPPTIMDELWKLNSIHHTGCIIFEVLPNHMKIHNYLRLLDPKKKTAFKQGLQGILRHISEIQGLGVAGFMKLPYKNTREFPLINELPEHFYPKNPKQLLNL